MTDEMWKSEYPFMSHFFKLADGHRMHFVHEGDGVPVLMVHGNPTWSFYYRNLIQALQHQYQTIAIDHIGCGLSDKPQSYCYTLSQHVDNLTQLMDHLQLQDVHLVVHDWGGPIGLTMAGQLPERIQSLTILNTGAFPPISIPWRIFALRFPLLGTLAIRGLNLFARSAIWMAMHRTKLSATSRAGLLAPYRSWADRIAVDGFVKDIPFTRKHPVFKELEQTEHGLSSLASKPVQLIWGMQDWCFTPKCLRKFQQHFPAADTMEVADAGHYVLEDAADQVISRVQQFLDDLS